MGDIVQELNGKILVCGDFNAKAVLWGATTTDWRGELITEWTAENDLRLVNVGNTPTCVRPQGTSIVDLTWASPGLTEYVEEWQVLENVETMSDHLYVSMKIGDSAPIRRGRYKEPGRWNFKKMDKTMFDEALKWACSVGLEEEESSTVSGMSAWIGRIMAEACDASAPKTGKYRKTQMYWWNATIADLRSKATKARRKWTRSRRRREQAEEIERKRAKYRRAKKDLKREIAKAKNKA